MSRVGRGGLGRDPKACGQSDDDVEDDQQDIESLPPSLPPSLLPPSHSRGARKGNESSSRGRTTASTTHPTGLRPQASVLSVQEAPWLMSPFVFPEESGGDRAI
jgi:hypothetical protein